MKNAPTMTHMIARVTPTPIPIFAALDSPVLTSSSLELVASGAVVVTPDGSRGLWIEKVGFAVARAGCSISVAVSEKSSVRERTNNGTLETLVDGVM